MTLRGLTLLVVASVAVQAACGGDDDAQWQVVHSDLSGALLSVWGTSEQDVWTVGGDPSGEGPTVMHWDGTTWDTLDTGSTGDLWWVFGFEDGPVYVGGAGQTILSYDGAGFTAEQVPSTGTSGQTVFGIWGASPDDVWAVGGTGGGASDGFIWHYDGDTWTDVTPDGLADDAIWKVFGLSADNVWMVGTDGATVHWDGQDFTVGNTGVSESLFTVHGHGDRFAAVGGFGTGLVLENDGTSWQNQTPQDPRPMGLIGVFLTDDGGYAVGQFGTVLSRDGDSWTAMDDVPLLDYALHAVWVDPAGGVWAVGGQVQQFPLINGQMIYYGSADVGTPE